MVKKIFQALTGREKILFVFSGAIALAAAFIIAGIFITNATKIVPASGGEYSEGMIGQPVYVNPVLASSEIDKSLVRLVFSNVSDVSDKIEADPDGRTWKIRLKENLRWQDGEKLTSDDVIFTIDKIQDPNSNSPLAASLQGISVSRISELELQINLVNPYAFLNDTLKKIYIVPKHIFADTPVANWRLSEYNLKPIGSGPYKFASYDERRDGFITAYHLVADNHYFGNHALLTNFDFQFFSKKDDLMQSFNQGTVDGIADLEPEDLASLKRPYDTFPFRLANYYAVFLNQSRNLALKDPAVRKALTYATNRDDLIGQALGGRGKPEFGPIPKDAPYYDMTVESVSSSLDLASTTLDAAGWKMGLDGVRAMTIQKSAVRLEFTIIVPQISFLETTANLLAQSWKTIGADVHVQALPIEDVDANAIKNRDYDALLFGNLLNAHSDLFPFWHSTERFYPGGNLSLYSNMHADALIDGIPQNMDDASRQQQYNDLQETIVGDYPAIFLYSPDYLYVTGKNIKGVNASFIEEPADRFRDAPNWYAKTARVLK